jgi:AraC-like DNA-binding protein
VLQAVTSVPEFLADPADRYIAGKCWLVFHVRGGVAGLVMWGAPAPTEIEPLFEIFRGFDSPLGAPLPRLFDVRRLESAQQGVLARLTEFVQTHATELQRLFTSIAVVHHGGLGRAITEGVRLLSGMKFGWGVFDAPAPALAWLGCRDAEPLAQRLDELSMMATGDALLLHDVRAYCTAHPKTACLKDAAHALRLSTRTLQRKLSDLETSFQRVMNDARVLRARQLLTSTNRAIADIAQDIGCEPRYFAAMFRKHTGRSPAKWRSEARIDVPPQQE